MTVIFRTVGRDTSILLAADLGATQIRAQKIGSPLQKIGGAADEVDALPQSALFAPVRAFHAQDVPPEIRRN